MTFLNLFKSVLDAELDSVHVIFVCAIPRVYVVLSVLLLFLCNDWRGVSKFKTELCLPNSTKSYQQMTAPSCHVKYNTVTIKSTSSRSVGMKKKMLLIQLGYITENEMKL